MSVVDGSRHRFTREEYQLLAPSGMRSELLDGEIIDVSPMKEPHAYTVMSLVQALTRRLDDDRHSLGSQIPIALSDYSEPEPDVWVARRPRRDFAGRKATPDDLVLIVEVADSSYVLDRNRKLPLYAGSGVSLVWIVDLNRRVVEVHAECDGEGYRSLVSVPAEGVLDLPWGGTLAVGEFMPPD
jgi:Uma2 family endonuclease